jgi:hypothetical protein
MQYLIIIAFGVPLLSCHSQTRKQKFHFPSIGWTITIPPGYAIDDSDSFYSKRHLSPHEPRTILFVHDTSGWNLTKFAFQVMTTPAVGSFGHYVDSMRADHRHYYASDWTPFRVVDSSFSETIVAGKKFRTESWESRSGSLDDMFVFYHASINGRFFTVFINYRKGDLVGDELKKMLRGSAFE